MPGANIKIIGPSKVSSLSQAASQAARVVPIDATWYMPNVKKLGFDTFRASRIPNSIFIDIDKVKDESSQYPHMLPRPDFFQLYMSKLGIRNSDKLVIYDQIGNFSAPRAAWMFDVFKHRTIYLLDNFELYKQAGLPIDHSKVEKESPYPASSYQINNADLSNAISFEEFYDIVRDSSKVSQYNILDARPQGRFQGADPEPRPGLPSGHAPFAISSPATAVLDPATKAFLPKEKLVDLFASQNVDDSKPYVVMCGTGVTACIVKSALEIAGLGSKGIKVYDGSWTEYAQRADPSHIIKD